MNLPDLAAQLAYWAPLLKLQAHDITMQYVPDLRAPASQDELEAFLTGGLDVEGFTGSQVWGLNIGSPDSRRARLFIRMPRTEAEAAEVPETVVHELLHCVTAAAEAPAVIDEQIVWTLAPLLTQLQQQEPQRARVLARAMGRQEKTLLVHDARARGNTTMADNASGTAPKPPPADKKPPATKPPAATDKKPLDGAIAKARALMQQIRHMLDPKVAEEVMAAIAAGDGEKALELWKAFLAAAASAGTYPEEGPATEPQPGMAQDPPVPPDPEKPPPTMGDEPEDPKYRALAKAQADDRAAAVDGLLDTRPDLSAKQRARLREIGIAEGVAKVREDLAELVPPPKAAEPAADTARARMGVDKVPTGGNGGKAGPSPDKALNARFRIFEDTESDGVMICDAKTTGRLIELGHFAAFAKIRKGSRDLVAEQRARMLGGAK